MKLLIRTSDCVKCQDKCCYFQKEDVYFSPVVTKEEAQCIDRRFLVKVKDSSSVYQIRLIKSKLKKGYLVCPFFDEKSTLCLIYKKRPLDCKLWPIVIAYSKKKKKIEIVCAQKNYCPRLKQINKKEFETYKNHVVLSLNKRKIIKRLLQYPETIWNHEKDYFKIGEINLISCVKSKKKAEKITSISKRVRLFS